MSTARGNTRIGTAIGVLTMVFGALLVIAPAAGAQEDPQNGNLAQECRTALGLPAGTFVYAAKWEQDKITGNFESPTETLGGFTAQLKVSVKSDPTELLIEFNSANLDGVGVMVVSQASVDHPVETYDPQVFSESATFPGDNIEDDVSHVDLCGVPQPDPGFLVIEKDVEGPAPTGDFSFQVDGDTHTIDNEGGSTDPIELPVGDYTVVENDDQGATSTSVTCTDGAASATTTVEGVTIAEGATTTCEFTNTFPAVIDDEPASLTIVKEVQGTGAPATWSFGFDGELGPFTLTQADPDHTDADLDPDTYTVNELAGTAGDGFTVASINCDDGTTGTIAAGGETGSVDVTLEAGDDVECTFVNQFTEVDDSTTNNPQPTVSPTQTPTAAVQGSQVLAATGRGTGALATLGIGLLVFGAVLTVGSRRRLGTLR